MTFEVFNPISLNRRNPDPKIRLKTVPNGSTRISVSAVVRDWIEFHQASKNYWTSKEAWVQILVSQDDKQLALRQCEATDTEAIRVTGNSSSVSFGAGDLGQRFNIPDGNYRAARGKLDGADVFLVNWSEVPR